MKTLSVIIPVFNAEKTIEKCIRSVQEQIGREAEIILVNDGSTDSSGKICDYLAQKDKRIIIIHKENSGVSASRNIGLSVASGKYVTFLDSDDWIETGAYHDAVLSMEKQEADITVWGYFVDYIDEVDTIFSSKQVLPRDIAQVTNNISHMNRLFSSYGYVWNKLYRRSTLLERNLVFDSSITLYEDMLFNLTLLSSTKKVLVIGKAFNHYIQRDNTLSSKYTPDYPILSMKVARLQATVLRCWRYPDTAICEYSSILEAMLPWNCVMRISTARIDWETKTDCAKKVLKQYPVLLGNMKHLNHRSKIKLILLRILPIRWILYSGGKIRDKRNKKTHPRAY